MFARFEPYLRRRLTDDPHVWATVLDDEVVTLAYERSYVTFARRLRLRRLRPHCEPWSGVKGWARIEIEHPPSEEIQWDWLGLPETSWGEDAHVLVGTLPHSERIRAVLANAEDQAHLLEAMDAVCRRLGGTARRWRVARIATIINPTRTMWCRPGQINRGLVRITTVTRLELGFSARSAEELRVSAGRPPVAAMPIDYLTLTIEERAVAVRAALAQRRPHRAPSIPTCRTLRAPSSHSSRFCTWISTTS